MMNRYNQALANTAQANGMTGPAAQMPYYKPATFAPGTMPMAPQGQMPMRQPQMAPPLSMSQDPRFRNPAFTQQNQTQLGQLQQSFQQNQGAITPRQQSRLNFLQRKQVRGAPGLLSDPNGRY